MELGGFADLGKGFDQLLNRCLLGIEGDGNGLLLEVTFQIFDTGFEGNVLFDFVDAILAMDVHIEDDCLPFGFRPEADTHQGAE